MAKNSPLIFPVVSLSAEYLVMGYLMRRNILTYKAPPNNAGYDLICIHPDPSQSEKHIRVQVKSRYQTDSDRSFFVKEATFSAFDYVALVLLNIGYFWDDRIDGTGATDPEIFIVPNSVARSLYFQTKSGMDRVRTHKADLSAYKGESGIELIAQELNIPYPDRPAAS